VRERACDATRCCCHRTARQAGDRHAVERNESQQLVSALASLGSAHAAHLQRELDVVRHRHVPEQSVVLEDDPISRSRAGIPVTSRPCSETRP